MARAAGAKGDPKKAVGYLRVSTEDQHLGPEAQRSALNAWCKANGAELVACHADKGVSGGTDFLKRPGFVAALSDLSAIRAGVFLVAKRDRLARDVVIAAMAERFVLDAGARIVSADGVGAGDGPESQLMRTLVDAFAQYERALIRHRTRSALAQKRTRSEKIGGNQRIGEKVDGDGVHVVEDPEELRAVSYIRSLRTAGLSLRAIVDKLNGEGVKCRGNRWHVTTVVRILKAA